MKKRMPKYLYEVGIEYFRKEVYECDLCKGDMVEFYDYNDIYICPDCAFKLNIIDEEEYIRTLPISLGKTRAIVHDGKIYLSLFGEKFEFEKNKQDYRHTTKYKDWRKAVFERDGYKCMNCGIVGHKLNAHHIKPYNDFPSYRFDVDNGITLCEKCHRKVHKELRKNGR